MITACRGGALFPHFSDEETEAQTGGLLVYLFI